MLKTNLTDKRIPFMIISILIILMAAAWSKASVYDTAKELSKKTSTVENESSIPSEDGSTYPQQYPFINILLLGLDEHGLSDQIMIASYNLNTHQVIITSVPRDTYVSEQTWSEKGLAQSHLCFAHYSGLGEDKEDYHMGAYVSARWIEYLLGIPIHEYASIEYESFIYLIDLIGGVEIYVDPAYAGVKPEKKHGITSPLPTGLQRLDGKQTFFYAHYRGDQDNKTRIPEPGSQNADGDRLRRNQRLLKAVYDQASSIRMLKLLPILKELPQHIHTSLTVWDITAFAPAIYNTNEVITIVMPGEFKEVYEEGVGEYTFYYYLDFEKSNAILEGFGLK